MSHGDAAEVFDAYVRSGPLRPLLTDRGPEFVAALRTEFLSRSPDGPWTHHPEAAHLVATVPA